MRTRSLVTLSLILMLAAPAWAQQPAGSGSAAPTVGSGAPDAPPPIAPDQLKPAPPPDVQPPVAQPPVAQPPVAAEPPMCRLAGPPPKPEPGKPAPQTQHSPMRQVCEDELIKDHDWWWSLEGRLRTSIHVQTSREVATNNKHVVAAYAAMWLLAVGFVLIMWRRQQAMKVEIARLEEQLRKVEEEDAKRKAAKAKAADKPAEPKAADKPAEPKAADKPAEPKAKGDGDGDGGGAA